MVAFLAAFLMFPVHVSCMLSRQALLCDLARPKVKDLSAGGSAPVPTPAILGIHGGCWRGGHRRDTSTIVVTQWAQQFGFCAMSIDYRLVVGLALL